MRKHKLTLIIFTAILISSMKFSYGQHEHSGTDTSKTDKVKDVVCGMEIIKNDSLKITYNEKAYFFCSEKDMLAFLKQPQKYTGGQIQNTGEHDTDIHKSEDHNHGMMGMSTMMIIMGGVMVAVMAAAMVIGMTGNTR